MRYHIIGVENSHVANMRYHAKAIVINNYISNSGNPAIEIVK